jgi:O-antigen ligase
VERVDQRRAGAGGGDDADLVAPLALSTSLPVALGTAFQEVGMIAAALAAAGAFVLPSPRMRAVSVLAALVLVPVLLVGELWDTAQFRDLRDSPALSAAAAVAGLAVMLALALVFHRRPGWLPIAAVAVLPFRIPVEAGGDTANLLVPLYLVVGAGCLAYAFQRLRRGGALAPPARPAGRVEQVLLLSLVLYAVQAAYSTDFEQALKNVAFFYVPFALLLKMLIDVDWNTRIVAACGAVALVLALVFTGVGFWEYSVRELLWNPKVIESNQFESYFRVNSLFFDPNIYGRFLAMVMLGLAATLLWSMRRTTALAAAACLAVLWGGLVLTFSQSSFGALLVGLAVLASLRWRPRPVLLASIAAGALAGAIVIAFPSLVKLDIESESSLDAATSGRIELMEGGLSMFADRPVLGYGSGSFADQFREREEVSSEQASAASHTIPITVAAEQGIVGLALYLLLLGTAFRLLFSGLAPLSGRGPPDVATVTLGYLAAAFAALVFHTLLYAAFLEDPLAWTLLGAALGIRLSSPGVPARARGDDARVPAARAAPSPS